MDDPCGICEIHPHSGNGDYDGHASDMICYGCEQDRARVIDAVRRWASNREDAVAATTTDGELMAVCVEFGLFETEIEDDDDDG